MSFEFQATTSRKSKINQRLMIHRNRIGFEHQSLIGGSDRNL